MGKRKKKAAPYAAQLDLPGPSSKKKKQKKNAPKAAQANNFAVEHAPKRAPSSRHVAAVGAKFKTKYRGLKPVPPQPARKKGGQKATKKAPPKKVPRIRLPSRRLILNKVPWMKASHILKEVVDLTEETDNDIIDLTQSPRRGREKLPTDDCDPELLEQFSQELRVFADYVRLTEKEQQAREVLLQQMHEVAVRQFQNSPEINVSDLALQVFGSYACKQVCTFCSDVDVALWGVVGPKITKQAKRATIADVEAAEMITSDAKKQRKTKWLRLLASADDDNLMSPDHPVPVEGGSKPSDAQQTIHAQTQPKDSLDLSPVCDPSEDGDHPLFVMDRKGVDPLEKEGATISVSVSTQETNTESETSFEEHVNNEQSREDEEKEVDSGNIDSSSDDDSADKLTEAKLRFASTALDGPAPLHRQPLSASSDSESDAESVNDTAVNFFHQTQSMPEVDASSFSKRKVVDGLERYFKGLRRCVSHNKIMLISRARVPIIKMESKLGIEVDCSIGGMNGADTSLYALKMCQKYDSFASVVVALKIIMAQQELDTPFSGGLGSYKLYVLVAVHIAKHLGLGGKDEPAEILMSFLFRYGGSSAKLKKMHAGTRTVIDKDDVVSCEDGGQADLSNVFLIQECRQLFGEAWKKLWESLRKAVKTGHGDTADRSFLAEVIHASLLDEMRTRNIASAKKFLAQSDKHLKRSTSIGLSSLRAQSPGVTYTSFAARNGQKRDLTEVEIVAGYTSPTKKRKTTQRR